MKHILNFGHIYFTGMKPGGELIWLFICLLTEVHSMTSQILISIIHEFLRGSTNFHQIHELFLL